MTAAAAPGAGLQSQCVLLNECEHLERCIAEEFCGAYLDDLRRDEPVDTDADDLVVLRGWSGITTEQAAVDHALTVMPIWRFHEAVSRLAARGHVVTSSTGAILGSSPSGRSHLAHRASAARRTGEAGA